MDNILDGEKAAPFEGCESITESSVHFFPQNTATLTLSVLQIKFQVTDPSTNCQYLQEELYKFDANKLNDGLI